MGAGQARDLRRHDRSVLEPELGVDDAAPCLQRGKGSFDRGDPARRRTTRREVAGEEVAVHEAAHGDLVALDDGLERGRGEVLRDDTGLGRGGDPDGQEQRAVDEEHQDGPPARRGRGSHWYLTWSTCRLETGSDARAPDGWVQPADGPGSPINRCQRAPRDRPYSTSWTTQMFGSW